MAIPEQTDDAADRVPSDLIRVSLDLESVLADIHPYFLSIYNDRAGTTYEHSDIDNWDWVRSEVDFTEFNEIVEHGWLNDQDTIAPREPELDETVEMLAAHPAVQLDIVTARTGVESAMVDWLETHGITAYESFHSTTESKANLGYDVFIDDKPGLASNLSAEQTQYLILGPHNQVAIDHDRTVPVDTVNEAASHLLDPLPPATPETTD